MRKIILPEIVYVLNTGRHEKKEDRFDETFNSWNYAVRGWTLDGLDLRVIVSFETEKDLLIITAFYIKKDGSNNMRNQKIKKEVIYDGLGFPIVLLNVPMIKLRGVWTPDIDLNVLQKVALLALAHHPTDLTGNQVRFIRIWLDLTQSEFGKLFGVTHPAVVKWEKSKNNVSKMNLTTQRDLRLWLLDQLLTRDEDFRKAFKIVHKTEYTSKIDLLKFDVPIDLVAI